MYRDLIEAPECYTVAGRDWWVRVIHRLSGAIYTVILLDDNADYVTEFKSLEECFAYFTAMEKAPA